MPRQIDSTGSGANVYAPDMLGAPDQGSAERLSELLKRAEDRSAWIQDICAALGFYPRLDELLSFIMERIRLIMDAERTTLYLLEDDGEHLATHILTDGQTTEVRLALGEGIAGWVARHGTSINVRDAYRDSRFDPRTDTRTGFRTSSVICQPMRDKDDAVMGVVQVLNKRSGYFTVDDEQLLSAITNTAAIVIQNRRLYLEMVDRNMQLGTAQRKLEERARRFHALYDIHRQVSEAADLDHVLGVVACAVGNMVRSYGCAISLVEGTGIVEHVFRRDPTSEEFVHADRTWNTSVRDHVIESGESVSRMAQNGRSDAAGITGRRPAMRPEPVMSIAAVPLRVSGKTIGCVELVERCRTDDQDELEAPAYSDEDLKLMDMVASEISEAVARSLRRQQAEMQGRLSAIGQMLSGVIHDTRTPLTIVSGYVQLMARTDDPVRRADLAKRVAAQFEHIKEMTGELLAYARGDTTVYLRTVHLPMFVEELREQLAHEFDGRGVEVEVSSSWRGDVRIDDGKLKRVVFNLARNAREAMDAGGKFILRFDQDDVNLILTVSDTGSGIPLEIQSKVFDAFVTSTKEGGSGLGLAVVKKLVDEHGGQISFESRVGLGTTFTIKLPKSL